MRRYRVCLLLLLAPIALMGSYAAAQPAAEPAVKAPTRLYTEPRTDRLLRMSGDRAHFRYIPGSLDRAANLQVRLEVVTRRFQRWTNSRLEILVYVLRRPEWEQSGYTVPYGIPIRVGSNGLAVPAMGDDGTVDLWSGLLQGALPSVPGMPLRGTPEQAATLVPADVLAQLQVGEMLVDAIGLSGDDHWVRGVMAHLAAYTVAVRSGTDRPADLATLYRLLIGERGAKALSARDYHPDLELADWLWFQGHFHFGARTLYEAEGKDALKKLAKKRRRRGEVLRGAYLRDRYKALDEWFRSSFSAVSLRTDQ